MSVLHTYSAITLMFSVCSVAVAASETQSIAVLAGIFAVSGPLLMSMVIGFNLLMMWLEEL